MHMSQLRLHLEVTSIFSFLGLSSIACFGFHLCCEFIIASFRFRLNEVGARHAVPKIFNFHFAFCNRLPVPCPLKADS